MRTTTDRRYVTRPIRTLDFSFEVEVPDGDLARYLDDAFAGCADDSDRPHRYEIVDRRHRGRDRFVVRFDGEVLDAFATPSAALALLLWHVNRQVVARAGERYVLIHAGAVARHGAAALFPAPAESGKSTLVAGLVARGFGYLTDEAAAVDPATGVVHPYPKPLSIDVGSWPVLRHLAPDLATSVRPWVTSQWHVPPDRVRSAAVAEAAPLRSVIAVRYDPSGPPCIEPMGRAAGVAALIENSFDFGRHGAAGLRALGRIATDCEFFRLRVRDLDSACELVARVTP